MYDRPLNSRQKRLVSEYAVDMNARRARVVAGYTPGNALPEHVKDAVNDKLKDIEEKSELRAEYVRGYIHCVLDFCPGDYFLPGSDGWLIDPESYKRVPREIRRLIEEMTLVQFYQNGQFVTMFSVRFVSKVAALTLAARYTLSNAQEAQDRLPWDAIAKELDAPAKDLVEGKLLAYVNELADPEEPYKAG